MRYRIPHLVYIAALSSALALGTQTLVTDGAQVHDARATVDMARALVQEEARAVQSIDCFEVSHQIDITTVTPRYNQTTHAYVKTWVQRPGRVRAESRQYTGSETIVSNGSTTWVYDSAQRRYWKQAGGVPTALSSSAFPGLARQLSSANLPSVATSAKHAGTEQLKIAGRSYLCDILDVSIAPSASNSMLQDNRLRLWVSLEYKVPLKVEAIFVGATPEGRKKYSDYVTDFEPNLNIPPTMWTFTPPSDAQQR